MAPLMSSRSEESPPVSVVAAILVSDPAALPETLKAVQAQVYEPVRVLLVGGDSRKLAEDRGLEWTSSLGAVLDSMRGVSHLWLVRAGALPRPDALASLVRESTRLAAGIAGSKLLREDNPEILVSVGIATDIFDATYVGLEPEERDQGQYDVLRDVAAVQGVSLLIRRDLLRGIGGPDPLLSPEAASIDLCQRARLRGARIVVVPSSAVLYPHTALRGKAWRDEGSRVRAMIKVYGALTLLWAIPLALLIGFIEAILSPFLGRWTLFSWLGAWVWNLFRLPSSLRARRSARRGRSAGDAELFQYQLRGSAKLRSLFGEFGLRLRRRLPSEEGVTLASLGRDLRQPALIGGVLVVVFAVLATRSIWANGLPAVGYSLPFPEPGSAALAAYAGGWNPAGLGSVEALRPLLAIVGVTRTVVLNNGNVAAAVLLASSYVFGAWGVVRLLGTMGVATTAGIVAGFAFVAGPAARTIAGITDLGGLIALGALPWVLVAALAPWPETSWGRIGRIAAVTWITGVTAALSPTYLVLPAAALALWTLLHLRDRDAWRALGLAVLGAGLAVALLLPWASSADLHRFLTTGVAFWEPGLILAIALAVALAATLIAAPRGLALIAGWGGLLVAIAAVVGRSADLGIGREVESAALAAASLGTAGIVGATFEGITRVQVVVGWRRLLVGVGVVAAALVAVSSVLVLTSGRAGLPNDALRGALGFTSARPGDPSASRALLVGPVEALPGDAYRVRGGAYRVVSTTLPDLWEAWLAEEGVADVALAGTLERMIDGETFRVGEELAPFGIRWIVVMGDAEPPQIDLDSAAWLTVLEGQLDLIPLGGGLRQPTFANEVTPAVRAQTQQGQAWSWSSNRYIGTAERQGRVMLADNADPRWGPGEWAQVGWGNEVAADEGNAEFTTIQRRRNLALLAGALLILLIGLSWFGRRQG